MIQPCHSFSASPYQPMNLTVSLSDGEIELNFKIKKALKIDSKQFLKAFSDPADQSPVTFDMTKREFYGLLNVLYPGDSFNVFLDEVELFCIAKKMECLSLLENLKKEIKDKVSSFQTNDINIALRYYRLLKDKGVLSFFSIEFARYFGCVFLDTKGKDDIDALIEVFNQCGVDQVELDYASQDQLETMNNWHELRSLVIGENKISSLRPLPKNLYSLKMHKACYLSSKVDYTLPQTLGILIIELGLWLNDDFVLSLPRQIHQLSLYFEHISHVALKSLSANITSLTLKNISHFTDESMELLPRELIHLEVRSLGLNLSERGFKAVPRKVNSLVLHGKMPEIRSNALGYLPGSLELLDISGCNNLTSDDLSVLSSLGQLKVAEMNCIRKPLIFLKQLIYLKIVRCIEFSQTVMFPDSLETLELVECYIPPEDLQLLPKNLKRLIVRNYYDRFPKEAIPDFIEYVDRNGEVVKKKGPNCSFGP